MSLLIEGIARMEKGLQDTEERLRKLEEEARERTVTDASKPNRAALPWTEREDEELVEKFAEFIRYASAIHHRTIGAISSRIRKLYDEGKVY